MKAIITSKKDTVAYESQINSFLSHVFNKDTSIDLTDEFLVGVLIIDNDLIIGCGFVYSRKMTQGKLSFIAGIVACVAVDEDHRGKGLCKKIINILDKQQNDIGVSYSFLFAYETNIYQSSGYSLLKIPIHYFDKSQKRWNEFVYRGGMIKLFHKQALTENKLIEFNGCVY